MAGSVTLPWALHLASRGFRIFPLMEGSSFPLWRKESGMKWTSLATNDQETIRKWWSIDTPGGLAEQNYNIGVLTTDMLVTDLDVKSDKQGIANFLKIGGDFDTFTVRTPSGGMHLYYSTPYRVAGSVGKETTGVAPGVDIRGFNNYVVGPGSVRDGKQYLIEMDAPIIEAPPAILTRCKRPDESANRIVTSVDLDTPAAIAGALAVLERASPGVTGRGHNDAVYSLACRVRDRGISEHMAVDMLLEHWNARCSPPLPPLELAAIVENAYAYAQNSTGIHHPAIQFAGVDIDPVEFTHTAAAVVAEPLEAMDWGNATSPQEMCPRPWLLKPILMLKEITVLTAPGGVGKSQAAITLAALFANGNADIWGFDNVFAGTQKRSVIYNAEDSRAEMSMRLLATCQALMIDYDRVKPFIMLVSGKEVRMQLVKKGGSGPEINVEACERIGKAAAHPDCVIVGLDPLRRIHGVRESDSEDMDFVMEVIAELAASCNVAVLVAHHTAKMGGAKYAGNAEASRGSTTIGFSARVGLTLSPPEDEDMQTYGIPPKERRRLLRLDDAKMNNSLTDGEPVWLEKITVILHTHEKVGAFVHKRDMGQRADAKRINIGAVIAAALRAGGRAEMIVKDAIDALRAADPIYTKMKPVSVRDQIELSLVRPIELPDGDVVKMEHRGAQKLITLT